MKDSYIFEEVYEVMKREVNDLFIDKELLNDIFVPDSTGNKYLILTNNGQTWIFDNTKIRASIEMYQPYTKKDQRTKDLIPSVNNTGFALKRMGIETVKISLQPDLKAYIDNLVGTGDYLVSAYMGDSTMKMNNKVTLQIYTPTEILCYIRISNDASVVQVMCDELEFIEYLEKKQVKNVPKIIDTNAVGRLQLFAQKSDKKLMDRVKLEFDDRHMKCIKDLVDKTSEEMPYEDTRFAQRVNDLKKAVTSLFPQNEKMIIQHSIRIIENKLAGKTGKYCAIHGDFSPWNIYYKGKEVCMYDFEYALYSMPCYSDVFHYITKMSLYGMQNDGDSTIAVYDKYKKLISQYCEDDTDFIYLCYLISIISAYSVGSGEKFSIYAHKYLDWIAIISYLNSRLD